MTQGGQPVKRDVEYLVAALPRGAALRLMRKSRAQQRLFVGFPALHELREPLGRDPVGAELLRRLEAEIPIKENPRAIPSLW